MKKTPNEMTQEPSDSRSNRNEVKVARFNTYDLMEISGHIDRNNAAQISRAFESLINAERFNILVDMTHVEYMSSSGFHALLVAQRNCKQDQRGEIILTGVPKRIQEVLDLSGFSGLFRIFEDASEAARSF